MKGLYAPLVAAAFLLSSCSANTFKDTITNFDSGVGSVQQTAQLYTTEAETTAVRVKLRAAAFNKTAILYDRRNCSTLAAKPPAGSPPKCALSDATGWYVPNTADDDKLFADLAILKTYSTNLLAVVNATTVDDLNKAESTVVTELGKVGTDVRKPPPPGVKAPTTGPFFATQVSQIGPILQPVVDEYIEHLRIDILREAVDQADPVIQHHAASVQLLLGELQKTLIGSKVDRVNNEVEMYNAIAKRPDASGNDTVLAQKGSDGANVAAEMVLQDALQENDDVRTLIQPEANLSAAVAKMAAAHAALKKDLDDPNKGVDLSSKSVYAFATQAAAAFGSAIQLALKK